tara:strand:- start:2025 stop:2516 length:492 start_codon:yes stop_codon:yes gene_type:complete
LFVQLAGLLGLVLKILPVHFFCVQAALGLVRVGTQDMLGALHQPLRCHPGPIRKRVIGRGVRIDADGSLVRHGFIPAGVAKVPPSDLAKKIACRRLLFQQGRVQRDAVATDGHVVERSDFFRYGGWLVDIAHHDGFVIGIHNKNTNGGIPGRKQQNIARNINQ